MRHLRVNRSALLSPLFCAAVIALAIDPEQRTADMPDSWLVLYNLNSPDSVAWAGWYQQQRNIPAANMLGLSASLEEHLLDLPAVQAQIVTPVRTLLTNDPALNQSIMGILLGYGLPGHYASPPLNPSVGGFSVADALQDMSDDGLAPASQKNTNMDNPHVGGQILPAGGRKTRANMAPNRYMVARIDAPSLAEAMALTDRASLLADPGRSLHDRSIWFDYFDPAFPGGNHEWFWLRSAVQSPLLADLPWSPFDLDGPPNPQAPGDAFRFDVYQLTNWNNGVLGTESSGRVLCFDFNSWGALTVRSTTASGGVYVPNAVAAGYAAAIGATGEPQCCVGPFPDTLLAALREGWTLGEAYYLANPFNDWMWTLVGDPFLVLPNWFDQPAPAATVTGASSWKVHAVRGDQGLVLNHVGRVDDANVTSESRRGGIVQLRIQFDAALRAGAETLAQSAVTIAEQRTGDPNAGTSSGYAPSTYAGSISTAASSGQELVLSFSPALPNARTYRISISDEISSVTGQSIEVRALAGDVNNSGQVTSNDRSVVVIAWTGPANYSIETDLDLSGETNAADRSLVVAGWTGSANTAP